MLQVSDVENNFDAGLAVGGVGGDVADVAFGVADHSGNVLQHAEAVVAENCQLHRISGGSAFVAGPFDVDAALGLIHQVGHVRTVDRVHSHALASGDVADNAFSANRITTLRAVDQHVALPTNCDGVVVTEHSAHYAGNGARLRSQTLRLDVAGNRVRRTGGQQSRQHLPRGIFSVADARHQVVGFAQAVAGSNFLQIFVFDFLQRDAILARLLFDQLASDFDGALALVNVEPVLDLISRAGRFDQSQPVSAGLVAGLRKNLDDVAGVQLVSQRHHAPIDFGSDAGVADFGVHAVGEVDRRRVAGQHHDLAFWSKRVNLFGIKIDLQRGKKFVGIADVPLPLDHLPQPRQALLVLR